MPKTTKTTEISSELQIVAAVPMHNLENLNINSYSTSYDANTPTDTLILTSFLGRGSAPSGILLTINNQVYHVSAEKLLQAVQATGAVFCN